MTQKVEDDRFAVGDALTEDELDTVSGGEVDDYCQVNKSYQRALNTWHYLVGQLEP
jgi:hypothetical protein